MVRVLQLLHGMLRLRLAALLGVALLGSAPLALGPAAALSPAQGESCLVIADFAGDMVGAFPASWKPREEEGLGVYRVMEERGLRFLRGTARESGVPAGVAVETWNVETHPVLAWRWRPLEFPHGADERQRRRDDSALGVYVVFPNPVAARSLKYVWSGNVPAGTEFSASLRLTHGRVLRTGAVAAGRWYEERVNVRDDFRRRFGDEVPRPVGIGVLTDADATDSSASGDYAAFRACPDA